MQGFVNFWVASQLYFLFELGQHASFVWDMLELFNFWVASQCILLCELGQHQGFVWDMLKVDQFRIGKH